jgi:hypothetical protein
MVMVAAGPVAALRRLRGFRTIVTEDAVAGMFVLL